MDPLPDPGNLLSWASRIAQTSAGLLLLARTKDPDTGPHILRSQPRQRMLKEVLAKPGLTMSELCRKLGIGWGSAYLHSNKLARAGEIITLRAGRRRIFVPNTPDFQEDQERRVAYLRGETAGKIARSILRHPNTRIKDICEGTGESQRVVYYHVNQLIEFLLVSSNSQTRRYGLCVTPLAQAFFDRTDALDPAGLESGTAPTSAEQSSRLD